ncbi:type II toxin-antitoxin system HicA family toxin [Azohydromonas aeria]|uniref:type II toxin-antitoxin system HicA family toxin n=1 Tax=Azohydromonas aeria TaxID=2590212 RepID=UPI001E48784C|nr:type II toxin-antitoxin system HicA family toxin [Azohydromonas aeria]
MAGLDGGGPQATMGREAAALPGRFREKLMSHRVASLLRTIFHDPPSGNVHWRDVESLLRHVGATLEPLSGARIRARIGTMEGILHRPHHSNTLDASGLLHVRQFLARSGVTPSQYENRP